MKLSKKLICLLTAILLVIGASACTGTGDPADSGKNTGDVTDSGTAESKPEETQSPDEMLLAPLLPLLPELASYTAVLPSSMAEEERKGAEVITSCLGTLLQTRMDPVDDDKAAPVAAELLFGKTSREGSEYQSGFDPATMTAGEYRFEVFEKRIVLRYQDTAGLLNAGLALLELVGREYSPDTDIKGEFSQMMDTVGIKSGEMRTQNIYSSNMLFQQNEPIVLRGFGDPGYSVEVRLEREGETVTSGQMRITEEGTWSLELEGQKGSYDSYELVYSQYGEEKVRHRDILFGELWIAAGQSNMQYTLRLDKDWGEVKFDDPYFRVLQLTKPSDGFPFDPMSENPTAVWLRGDRPEAPVLNEMRVVSAVGYYYAARLREELDVPVGLLLCAVGGAPIRSFISDQTLAEDQAMMRLYTSTGRYFTRRAWNSDRVQNQSSMYNAIINTIKGLNIAGMLWYQGEQDCAENKNSYLQELWCLYRQFCREFNFPEEDMPFLYPTIVPYLSVDPVFGCGLFTTVMTEFARQNENAVCVPIYDVSPVFRSDNNASHPEAKKPVGTRLATAALATVYGAEHEGRPPYPVSMETDGNSLILTFENVGDGLMTVPYQTNDYSVAEDHTPLRGFTVCGEDGVYYMADAEIIDKNRVRLTSPSVERPISANYAVMHLTFHCNLASSLDGKVLFMASPFRLEEPEEPTLSGWHDWADCDVTSIWHVSRRPIHYGRFYDAWYPVQSAEVSHSSEEFCQGNAALKLTGSGSGFGAGVTMKGTDSNGDPVLFIDVNNDYSTFSKIRFRIKVTEGSATFDGISFSSGIAAKLTEGSASLTAGGEWLTLTVDLNSLSDSYGNQLGREGLKNISKLELLFSSTGSCTLYLDDIQLLR